jgi:hypothetical protein
MTTKSFPLNEEVDRICGDCDNFTPKNRMKAGAVTPGRPDKPRASERPIIQGVL